MARETKVGLLAGLAFIICFAVILANRGANGPPGLANSFLPNGGLELPKLVQRNQAANGDMVANTGHNRNRQPTRQLLQEPPTNHTSNAGNSQSQHAMIDSVPATGTQLPPVTSAESVLLNPETTLAQNTRPIDVPTIPNAGLEKALTSPISMTATMPLPPEPVTTSGRVVLNEPAPVASATAQSTAPIQGTPYTVKASDTLSSIASAHYGTKSKQAVETIFDANRSVLTDINNVKLGTILVIPRLSSAVVEKNQPAEKSQPAAKSAPPSDKMAEAKGKGSDRPAPEKKSAEKEPAKKVADTAGESEKNSKNFKWYQVKKNDRFASIAREQLGDEGRWQEVYELNKDKFPDPQHIREGVRIKLPAPMTLASAGKEKRR